MLFKLASKFAPAGDQPAAIRQLVAGRARGDRYQTLLGVTGSGKTFTAANVIAAGDQPALVIAHNKTLAAQLVQEYRDFFPENEVHYFVSYYDYYQPEAYLAPSDTYIEKEAQINEEIDRLRHAATAALLTRRDVIVVASVSCLYGLGSPEDYRAAKTELALGAVWRRSDLLAHLIANFYQRTTADLTPGSFRLIGNRFEIMPPAAAEVYSFSLHAERLTELAVLNPVSRVLISQPAAVWLFPAKHFVTPRERLQAALKSVKQELDHQLKKLLAAGRHLEAERLRRRTTYDLTLLREVGYCHGIENYSRHLSGRTPGAPPDTLLSYFPKKPNGAADFITIIDESHVTLPQLAGMAHGDRSRKESLVTYGFRLPSAFDNRPLNFEEFSERVDQVIFTSATPGEWERRVSAQVVEQIIRPTGLVDPQVTVHASQARKDYPGQIVDFIAEARSAIEVGQRVLATTLTKKMAEELSDYLKGQGIKAEYLHSEVKTLDRIKLLSAFRQGEFDCLVGVNLLREGLDLPEVALIGILDADREGFLRSETSLIQTIGRAARNVSGRVILYAERTTGSLERAVAETERRRARQLAHNRAHRITPRTIIKKIQDITATLASERNLAVSNLAKLDLAATGNRRQLIREKEKQMTAAVKELDFETAAILRDEIKILASESPKKKPKKTKS